MTVLAFQLSNEASLFWILVIIAVCFVVMAIAMLTIAIAVFRVVAIVRALQERVEPIIQKVDPLMLSVNQLSAQGKEIAEKFTDLSAHLSTATKHFSESAGLIKEEVVEIKALIGQSTEVARDKVALVSRTIERTNGQVQDTADLIQSKVVEPAREIAAIMAGFKRGLEVLFAPSPRELNRAYSDDEMFIG